MRGSVALNSLFCLPVAENAHHFAAHLWVAEFKLNAEWQLEVIQLLTQITDSERLLNDDKIPHPYPIFQVGAAAFRGRSHINDEWSNACPMITVVAKNVEMAVLLG